LLWLTQLSIRQNQYFSSSQRHFFFSSCLKIVCKHTFDQQIPSFCWNPWHLKLKVKHFSRIHPPQLDLLLLQLNAIQKKTVFFQPWHLSSTSPTNQFKRKVRFLSVILLQKLNGTRMKHWSTHFENVKHLMWF